MIEMGEQNFLEKLKECVANFDIDKIQKVCRDALVAGVAPYRLVMDGMAKGMDVVGRKYEAGEYFLAELIMAGETMKEGMKILEPHLKKGELKKIGRVVIGTVRGDLHDIGKNVVGALLSASGFDVIDLGVDVPTDQFVEAVRVHKPDILGMSALLTVTMPKMEDVIKKLEETGLRGNVRVIIGGAPLTEDYAKKISANAYASNAVAGVKICKEWLSKQT